MDGAISLWEGGAGEPKENSLLEVLTSLPASCDGSMPMR